MDIIRYIYIWTDIDSDGMMVYSRYEKIAFIAYCKKHIFTQTICIPRQGNFSSLPETRHISKLFGLILNKTRIILNELWKIVHNIYLFPYFSSNNWESYRNYLSCMSTKFQLDIYFYSKITKLFYGVTPLESCCRSEQNWL